MTINRRVVRKGDRKFDRIIDLWFDGFDTKTIASLVEEPEHVVWRTLYKSREALAGGVQSA